MGALGPREFVHPGQDCKNQGRNDIAFLLGIHQSQPRWPSILFRVDYDLCADFAQEIGTALGAQAGEAKLREVISKGGFTRIRPATETPFNMILEARP
jgi:hypothetical protein